MTDKEKIAKECLELIENSFEDQDNLIFIKDISEDYVLFLKGKGEKLLNMTLELCKTVIQNTGLPINVFIKLFMEKLEKETKGFTISDIKEYKEEGEDAKEKGDPLH